MKYYAEEYISDAYHSILYDLKNNPEFIASPRNMEVKEIRDCTIKVNKPMVNLFNNEFRSSPIKYISAELFWYFSGTNKSKFIENYASLWSKIKNPDNETVNSAYGHLIFSNKNEHGLTQYQWVIDSLKKDKESRQAFMHFNTPEHQWFGNKDQVCTLQALFHIRDNKLHMTLTMRSNDVILGFMTDWAFFSVLQYHVYLHLKEYYPELKMGSYTHISHSMHLYAKHYDLVEKMLTTDFFPESLPLLNETILEENGSIKSKYNEVFDPILKYSEIDKYKITDNSLLNYCYDKLKPIDN